ncbi:MAG: hypothetical protein ABSC65_04755 [Acidobacteriaceae bacterium]|jgi:hypothetical protein
MRPVVNRVLLLATLLLGREAVLGQQQASPQNLPDAPQPSVSVPVQGPSPAGTAPSRPPEGVTGQKQNPGQRGNSRPGFPPISPPAPGLMPVPPAARPNIFGVRSDCRPDSSSPAETIMSCQPNIPIYNRFLDSATPLPLTARQKFILAARNVSDPFNLLTIGGLSAISVIADSHTADGPGFDGFAKNAGVSLSQDMTGEFFGTFLIPAITHQDPHYHRMPNLSVRRRILHVIDAVVISQSDQGAPMFNYSTVVGTLCTNSLGNVYVPGRKHSFGASAARISTSLATDPIGNAITEFVPDLARHVNIQVVIVQRLINRVAIAEGGSSQE